MNTYQNLLNGREVIEPDSEYQKRLKTFSYDYLVDTFFSDYKSIIEKLDVGNEHEIVFSIPRDDGSIIYFAFESMKNSGTDGNSNKRYQVYPYYYGQRKIYQQRRPEDTYYFIGLYPTGDTSNPICVLMDNDGVSYNPTTTYSSCWVRFAALKTAFEQGISYSFNSDDFLKNVCFTKDKIEDVMFSIFHNDFTNLIGKNGEIDFNGSKKPKDEVKDFNEEEDIYNTAPEEKIRRNPNLRDLAIFQANYTCSLCGKKETFLNNSDVQYFEAHHLIPCNPTIQKRFSKKLDALVNMFCLCPECHRKIHYVKKSLLPDCLEKLYMKQEVKFKEVYHLGLSDLLAIYHVER